MMLFVNRTQLHEVVCLHKFLLQHGIPNDRNQSWHENLQTLEPKPTKQDRIGKTEEFTNMKLMKL